MQKIPPPYFYQHTLRVSIKQVKILGTTANISAGALGNETTEQDKLSAALLISGSASPVTN
jgi:hypothetical protein